MPDVTSSGPHAGSTDPGIDRIVASTAQLRDAAKWMLALLGALASILLSGLRFVDVAGLAIWSWEFCAAALGIALATAGLGYLLVGVARLLSGRYLSLRQVLTHAEEARNAGRDGWRDKRARTKNPPSGVPLELVDRIVREVQGERVALYGATTATTTHDLFRLHRDLAAEVARAPSADTTERLIVVRDAAARVAAFADERYTRIQFQRLGRRLLVAGPLMLAGVMLVSLATGRPEAPKLLPAPIHATVYLTEEGRNYVSSHLGCRDDHVEAVLVGGDARTPLVVVKPEGGCRAGRLAVTDAIGTVIPG